MRIQKDPSSSYLTPYSRPGASQGCSVSAADVCEAVSSSQASELNEVGEDKTLAQHAGNLGFGVTTAANLLKLAANAPFISKMIPGLNLGVAGIESVNAIHMYHQGNHTEAATHLGNAAGCTAGFLQSSGALAMTANHSAMGGGLALAGGVLGLGVGLNELRLGHKLAKETGSKRTLAMGVIDVTSGLASLGAAVLALNGVTGHLGIGLLIASSVCDLSGIVVDYGGKKLPGLVPKPGT